MAEFTMLRELRIRNLAVIEEVTVPFASGLNVLTGETGAGKSILVDAILLVLGARAHPDLIRSGEDLATVQAVFDVEGGGPLAAVLDEAGHPSGEGQLIVKREISRAGRHRVYVNDAPATVGLLERLGEHLVELHGQHEHQRLLEPQRQLGLLDRFGESEAQRERVAHLVGTWRDARNRQEQLEAEMREQARQEDLYRFQLSEIDAVDPRDGEEEALRAERNRLQHAERIVAGLGEAMAVLYEDDGSVASGSMRGSRPWASSSASMARMLARSPRTAPESRGPWSVSIGATHWRPRSRARSRALRPPPPPKGSCSPKPATAPRIGWGAWCRERCETSGWHNAVSGWPFAASRLAPPSSARVMGRGAWGRGARRPRRS
jgi:DNA repair ATPase RecN